MNEELEQGEITLSIEQKEKVKEIYSETPDLITITRGIFNNPKLDGRSKEGRAIRRYLAEAGLSYKTTKKVPVEDVFLTSDQKTFILNNAESMTPFEMAKCLWPENNIRSALNKESVAVLDFLRSEAPEKIQGRDSAIGLEYVPPRNFAQAIAKINVATHQELSPHKLSAANRQNIAAYIRFINSPRIIQLVQAYTDKDDRELFENEFTRSTWDKPDLTADEITLYIGVCQDIVHNKHLLKNRDSLNRLLASATESEDGKELTIRLAESMKAVNDEYDKVQKRIESVIKKLNGDRSARIKERGAKSANILALVEAFQMEDERKRLLRIALAKQEQIKNEADRLESLDDYKVRILGISKIDIL